MKVILDADLAHIYGVETKNLNKACRRNMMRFPEDFVFRLTADEAERLRFQIRRSVRCFCRARNPPRRRSASVSARRKHDTRRRPVRRRNPEGDPAVSSVSRGIPPGGAAGCAPECGERAKGGGQKSPRQVYCYECSLKNWIAHTCSRRVMAPASLRHRVRSWDVSDRRRLLLLTTL